MAMENNGEWSEAQVELFNIFGQICDSVGGSKAPDLVKSIKNGNKDENDQGRGGDRFLREISDLRQKSHKVDRLEIETQRLRAELEKALGLLDNRSGTSTTTTGILAGLAHGEGRSRYESPSVPADDVIPGADVEKEHGVYNALVMKHNILVINYQELVSAREELEKKLRARKESERKWVDYANALEKKLIKQESQMKGRTLLQEPHRVSPGVIPLTPTEIPYYPEASNSSIPAQVFSIAAASAGATLTVPQEYPQYYETQSSKKLIQGLEEDIAEPPAPQIHNSLCQLKVDSSQSSTKKRKLLCDTPWRPLLGDVEADQPIHDHPSLSSSAHSIMIEDEIDAHFATANKGQPDELLSNVKTELLSDMPVVISSRAVRKKRQNCSAGPKESPKIKIEMISSSPIGLLGLENLWEKESMDLDDIGEKIDTPKKKRQITYGSDTHVQRGSTDALPRRKSSALQPTSPNKLILPRTSDKERRLKHRRSEDYAIGLEILGEDGENEADHNKSLKAGMSFEKLRKRLPADSVDFERQLDGLLHNPSPRRQVLMPARASLSLTTAAQQHPEYMLLKRPLRHSTLGARQADATVTPKSLKTPQNSSNSERRMKVARSGGSRTLEDRGDYNGTNPDQEPLRTRPVRLLGLENFKVNPNFNQGYEYAFADVVRGREQRKCLPSCTKPECCGDKFRTFVEIVRRSEGEQTSSQEEEDQRILEEYMGDNVEKLRSMTRSEKNEILVQAKTRELAHKAGKHRHAYERRRSPPGFWRTDFPSTQELEADRAEADRLERDLVNQRYEEAMRPGGRWIFRDERHST